ncbi:lipase [Besnoitia besnoiti]|uniref:Lipase n=1 Tax=Besnoitia besnoiti TaxID=94643 RepID=A0A2A9M8L5_BESBE|nr:lipase [Besnoitia besnoiti]PFH32651.1 lipase [Besnoitia besnoiti]
MAVRGAEKNLCRPREPFPGVPGFVTTAIVFFALACLESSARHLHSSEDARRLGATPLITRAFPGEIQGSESADYSLLQLQNENEDADSLNGGGVGSQAAAGEPVSDSQQQQQEEGDRRSQNPTRPETPPTADSQTSEPQSVPTSSPAKAATRGNGTRRQRHLQTARNALQTIMEIDEQEQEPPSEDDTPAPAPSSTPPGSQPGSLGAATRLVDMTRFGMNSGFNQWAFKLQQHCSGLYPTVLMRPLLPGAEQGVCVLDNLLDAVKLRLQDTSPATKSSSSELATSSDTSPTRRFRGFVQQLKQTSSRKALGFVLRRQLRSGHRKPEELPKILSALGKKVKSLRSLIPQLFISFLMCQPTLSAKTAFAGNFTSTSHFDNDEASFVTQDEGAFLFVSHRMPPAQLDPFAPQTFPSLREQWQKELMKSLAVSLQLVDTMMTLGDDFDGHIGQSPSMVFPKPWLVEAVVAPAFTEYSPIHGANFDINPVARSVLRSHKVTAETIEEGPTGKKILRPNCIRSDSVTGVRRSSAEELPVVNPDKCYRTASFANVLVSPLAVFLVRDRDQPVSAPGAEAYPVDSLVLIRGPKYAKEWTAAFMSRPVGDSVFLGSDGGRLHEGYTTLFHQILRETATAFAQKLKTDVLPEHRGATPFNILITGISTGRVLANLLTWFLAIALKDEVAQHRVRLHCSGFGTPPFADEKAHRNMHRAKAVCWNFHAELDPMLEIFRASVSGDLVVGNPMTLDASTFLRAALRSHDGRFTFHGLSWAYDQHKALKEGHFQGKTFVLSAIYWLNLFQASAVAQKFQPKAEKAVQSSKRHKRTKRRSSTAV